MLKMSKIQSVMCILRSENQAGTCAEKEDSKETVRASLFGDRLDLRTKNIRVIGRAMTKTRAMKTTGRVRIEAKGAKSVARSMALASARQAQPA